MHCQHRSSRRCASSRHSVVVVVFVIVVVIIVIVIVFVILVVIVLTVVIVIIVIVLVIVVINVIVACVVVIICLCCHCCPVIIAVIVVIVIAFGWLLYLPLPLIWCCRHLCALPPPPPNPVVLSFFVASPLPTPLSLHCRLSPRTSPVLAGCCIANMLAINDKTWHTTWKKPIKSCDVGNMLAMLGWHVRTTRRHVFKINLLKTSKMSTFPAKPVDVYTIKDLSVVGVVGVGVYHK
jgi:hypothetical protein